VNCQTHSTCYYIQSYNGLNPVAGSSMRYTNVGVIVVRSNHYEAGVYVRRCDGRSL
jgi:hypothetical protein